MSMLPSRIPCPDCRGRGSILLLFRTVPCTRCQAKGSISAAAAMDLPLSSLHVSSAAKSILQTFNVSTLRDVAKLSEGELRTRRDTTDAIILEVKKALAGLGLSLRPSAPVRVGKP